MGSGQFHHIFEERMWRRDVAVDQVLIEGNGIDFSRYAGFKDGFDLRTEEEASSIPVVIQRLLAKAVPRSQEALTFSVPQCEDKHTSEMLDTIIAIFLVGMYDRLCIAFRGEVMTARLQFSRKLTVIIDLSIADHKDTSIFVKHRLMTSREIDDRETPHA